MIAERLGVHCASTLKLVSRVPLSRQLVDARCGRAARDAASVRTDLAVTEIVHQDEDDVGLGVASLTSLS
jgi:hypothetical protein